MKPEIAYQINSEIINKILSSLYVFSYTDEEPSEDVVIMRFTDLKVTLELLMDLHKNVDGIITNCAVKATITTE